MLQPPIVHEGSDGSSTRACILDAGRPTWTADTKIPDRSIGKVVTMLYTQTGDLLGIRIWSEIVNSACHCWELAKSSIWRPTPDGSCRHYRVGMMHYAHYGSCYCAFVQDREPRRVECRLCQIAQNFECRVAKCDWLEFKHGRNS